MPDRRDDPDHAPVGYEPVKMAEAARRLGISENAVAQRRKRGTVYGKRVVGEWLIWLPPVGTSEADRIRARSRATRSTGPNDMASLLADVIRQHADLAALNAVLTERNRVLTERLAALEAGPVAAARDAPEPIPMPEPDASASVVAGMAVGRAVAAQDAPNGPLPMQAERTATDGGNRLRRAWNAIRGR